MKSIANYVLNGMLEENKELLLSRLEALLNPSDLEALLTPLVVSCEIDQTKAVEFIRKHNDYNDIGMVTPVINNGRLSITYKYTKNVYVKDEDAKRSIESGAYASNYSRQTDDYCILANGIFTRSQELSLAEAKKICSKLITDED